MVGLWLSLNVLSFQTSLETWTTAAIINWTGRWMMEPFVQDFQVAIRKLLLFFEM